MTNTWNCKFVTINSKPSDVDICCSGSHADFLKRKSRFQHHLNNNESCSRCTYKRENRAARESDIWNKNEIYGRHQKKGFIPGTFSDVTYYWGCLIICRLCLGSAPGFQLICTIVKFKPKARIKCKCKHMLKTCLYLKKRLPQGVNTFFPKQNFVDEQRNVNSFQPVHLKKIGKSSTFNTLMPGGLNWSTTSEIR